MSKILVAGGAGYIGSHTVKELRRAGFEPVVFDNLSSGRREAVGDAEFVRGDLHNEDAVAAVFKNGGFSAVLHFASLIQVGESYLNPHKYYRHNLFTSLNLLEGALEAGVRAFIFSSSAAVYGMPREIPIREDHPLEPINPYGRTKLTVEKILEDFDRAYGLRFVSLRYFNAAGADPDGGIGEHHDPETHLIPNVLRAAAEQAPSFSFSGRIFRRRMEPPSETTSMSPIWPRPTSSPSATSWMEDGANSSTWGATAAIPSGKSSPRPRRRQAGPCPGKKNPGGKATPPSFSPRRKRRSGSWAGRSAIPTWTRS